MRINSTLILLVVVASLGAFIWFFERRAETTEQREDRVRRALHIAPDRISYLEFSVGDFGATCEKHEGVWELVSPVKGRADGGEVDRILWGLKGLEQSDIVTAKEQKARKIDRAAYGFTEPRATITIGDASGDAPSQSVGTLP